MDLEQHYAELLNLEAPWQVQEVAVDFEARTVEIRLAWAAREVPCPVCGRGCPVHPGTTEEIWPYLNMMAFSTRIRTRLLKAVCVTHGIRTLAVPWADAVDGARPD